MPLAAPALLLFGLNLLDALLTILWVRTGVATEGNELMARLLEIGNGPFLAVKIVIGVITVAVLMRWGNRPVAKYGVAIALAVYISLMGIHLVTGLEAFGWVSANFSAELSDFPGRVLASFV